MFAGSLAEQAMLAPGSSPLEDRFVRSPGRRGSFRYRRCGFAAEHSVMGEKRFPWAALCGREPRTGLLTIGWKG